MRTVVRSALPPAALPPDGRIGRDEVAAAIEAGALDPQDLPPKLPPWLDDVWRLYERVAGQLRENGSLDYNPVIRLVEVAGAAERLWEILELLQVIEAEEARARKDRLDAEKQRG